MTTLSDLLQARNQTTLQAILLGSMQSNNLPVTDWYEGGVALTIMQMFTTGLLDRENLIPFLAGANFLDYASTMVDANGNLIDGWMELLAWNGYGLNRVPATYTKIYLTLTCTSGPGPYTQPAGGIIAYSPSTGNNYTNTGVVTIPNGGSVTAVFQSQTPGAIAIDAAGSVVAMVTPLPGVSVSNLPTAAGQPTSAISGTGTIAVTSTGITTTLRTVVIAFTTAGRVSDHSAYFTATVYQGTSQTVLGPYAANATYTQGDLTVTLTDGPVSTTSFNAGDTWTVSVPGSPYLQIGTDKETLAALATRCRGQFPSQSPIATPGRYVAWAQACNAAQHLGLTKFWSQPSIVVAGQEDVFLAGPTATATPTQVSAVQSYTDVRVSDIESANVQSAASLTVNPTGTVYTHRGTTASVQAAAIKSWTAYIAALPIGGSQPGGFVLLSELEQAIMDAGAYDTSGLMLNSSAANITLSRTSCAALPSGDLSTQLTWLEVA